MTSKPMVLVFLLLILIITSQFEWKQQLVNDFDTNQGISQKQLRTMKREEEVKEKIILRQEKDIQRLHERIRNLQQQLLQCQSMNTTENFSSSTSITNDVDDRHGLED